MNDGRTYLAYKAEHAVDLPSEAIVSAHVTHADRGATTPAGRRAWCWRMLSFLRRANDARSLFFSFPHAASLRSRQLLVSLCPKCIQLPPTRLRLDLRFKGGCWIDLATTGRQPQSPVIFWAIVWFGGG